MGPWVLPFSDRCSQAPPGLQVLETCVKNCGHRFHVLVASQDFVEGVLVRTILPKNNPPTIVHDKVLNLIQVSAGGRGGAGRKVPTLLPPPRSVSCLGPPGLSVDWTFRVWGDLSALSLAVEWGVGVM